MCPLARSLMIILTIIIIAALYIYFYEAPASVERFPRPSGKLGRIKTPIPAPRPSERAVNESIARAGLSDLWAYNQSFDITSAPTYGIYDNNGSGAKFQTKGFGMEDEIKLRAALRQTGGLW